MSEQAMQRAIEGLEMGFRVIASELNDVLAKRGLTIECDAKLGSDSISLAVDSMICDLENNKPGALKAYRIYDITPWTLGFVEGEDRDPRMISLGTGCIDEIRRTCKYLDESKDCWSQTDWQTLVINPVVQQREFMLRELRGNHVSRSIVITGPALGRLVKPELNTGQKRTAFYKKHRLNFASKGRGAVQIHFDEQLRIAVRFQFKKELPSAQEVLKVPGAYEV